MKKRILSLILSAIMLLVSLSAFAQQNTEDSLTKNTNPVPEYAAYLLDALGIMDIAEANADREIQRGYAAEILFKLAKIDEGVATGAYYSDVAADTPYAYAIEKMTELGYFRGVGGGEFHPDGYIAVSDMARLLLQFAGYGAALSNTSVTSEIYNNVGVSGYTTYRDLAHMIFNLFKMDAMSVTELTPSGGSFSINKNLTVMADLFDVYEIKGTVTENDLTGLWGDSTLNENEFIIKTTDGNFILKNGKTDAGSNIGKYIRVFYQYDKDSDSYVSLSYSVERSSGVYDVNLLDFNFASSTDNELKYRENGTNKKVRYNSQTSMIYNGTYYSDAGFSFDALSGLEGTITVIDNNSDNVADILDITAYKTYVVKSVVLSDGRVFSKNTNEVLILDEEEYDKFSLTDINGVKMYLEDFVPGTILSVAKNASSSEKQVLKAYACNDSVNEKISSIYEEDGKPIIEAGERTISVLDCAGELPRVGAVVGIKLSVFGNAAYFDYSSTDSNNYAVITDVVKKDPNNQVYVKLFKTDESYEEIPVANNVKIDGVKIKSQRDIYDTLVSTTALRIGSVSLPKGVSPIIYKQNAEGEISYIDTPLRGRSEDLYTLTKMNTTNGDKGVLISDLVIGGEVAVNSYTPVFRFNAVITDNKIDFDYVNDPGYTWCMPISDLSTPRSMDYVAYKTNPDSKYADMIVTYSNYSGWDPDENDGILLVEDIYYGYNSETDQWLTKVRGYQAGVKKDYFVANTYTETFNSFNIKKGDAIRFSLGAYDHIARIEGDRPTVSHKEDGFYIRNVVKAGDVLTDFTTGWDNLMLLYGYALEREDNLLKISYKDVGAYAAGEGNGLFLAGTRSDTDMEGKEVLVRIPSSVPVTVYDPTADEEVYQGTYDEILAYDSVGTACSMVLLRYRNQKLAEILVFNNASLYN